MAVRSCSSCGHEELEPGFMLAGQATVGHWMRGELELNALGQARTRDRDRFTVQAFRCPRCEHLDLFTTGKPWR